MSDVVHVVPTPVPWDLIVQLTGPEGMGSSYDPERDEFRATVTWMALPREDEMIILQGLGAYDQIEVTHVGHCVLSGVTGVFCELRGSSDDVAEVRSNLQELFKRLRELTHGEDVAGQGGEQGESPEGAAT